MLEQALDRLTLEVVKLRSAVERQTLVLERSPTKHSALAQDAARQEAQDVYVTEHAVAELCGVSVALLRRWRLFRKGPPYLKLGRLVRYSRSEVVAWMEGQRPSHQAI